MLKIRTLMVGLFLLVGVSISSQSKERPDFAGKWTVVPERNVPAGGSGALGTTLSIDQTASTITIARVSQMTMMAKDAGGRDEPRTIERLTTNSYTFDGVERELATAAVQMAGGGGQARLDLTSTYRAVWTTDQLVLMTLGRAAASLAARTKDQVGQLKQVGRTSIAFESDDTLVVDRVTVLDPEAGGPKENAPVSLRSFYRRDK
jgi:hypothetical protein